MTEKIILGIDPGTNIMGYGVLKVQGKQAEMLALGVIDLRKYADHYLKLGHIFEGATPFLLDLFCSGGLTSATGPWVRMLPAKSSTRHS